MQLLEPHRQVVELLEVLVLHQMELQILVVEVAEHQQATEQMETVAQAL